MRVGGVVCYGFTLFPPQTEFYQSLMKMKTHVSYQLHWPKLSRTEHTAIFNKSHGKTNNRTSNKGLHAVGRRY